MQPELLRVVAYRRGFKRVAVLILEIVSLRTDSAADRIARKRSCRFLTDLPLTELRRALPGVTLFPDPVLHPEPSGFGPVVTVRLTAEEYTKYLLAQTVKREIIFQRPFVRDECVDVLTRGFGTAICAALL